MKIHRDVKIFLTGVALAVLFWLLMWLPVWLGFIQ